MKSIPEHLQGVLFDLDGTLLDSAPDLYTALVEQCAEENTPPPAFARMREVVSRGSRAILRTAFASRGEAAIEALAPRYLALYQHVMARETGTFPGIDELLERIESQGLRWGIVTNKPGFLTDELVVRVGWADRVSAVVSGDTLPVKKPDPAPVLLACDTADVVPARCVFVGDDRRDVQAGAAAGCYTVAVQWGYLDGGDPHTWGADVVIDQPSDLINLLKLLPATA